MVECKRYHSRFADGGSCYKEGRKPCDYHVMDQDKSVLCAAEISITLLKRFKSF